MSQTHITVPLYLYSPADLTMGYMGLLKLLRSALHVCRYTRMFVIKTLTPAELLRDAAFCMAFLGYWRLSVEAYHDPKDPHSPSLRQNFLTEETFKDLLISCNNVVLGIVFHITVGKRGSGSALFQIACQAAMQSTCSSTSDQPARRAANLMCCQLHTHCARIWLSWHLR